MITIREAVERSNNGPLMDEKDFEKRLQLKIRKVAGDSGIALSSEEIIPDPAVGQLAFDAGVELGAEVGIYNRSTGRVIEFTRRELREVARTRRSSWTLGEGKDARTFEARRIGDPRPPKIIMGPAGIALTEENYVPITQSYAQIPEIDAIIPGALLGTRGMANTAGTPEELTVAWAEVEKLREVARAVGRPGMGVVEVPMSPSSLAAAFATYNYPGGFDPAKNMLGLQLYPGNKCDWDHINKAAFAHQFGIQLWTSTVEPMGLFTRTPVEMAISSVAAILMFTAITDAQTTYEGSSDAKIVTSSAKMLQAHAIRMLANASDIGWATCDVIFASAGPCTDMILQELAALSMMATVAGTAVLNFGCGGKGDITDGATGTEGQIMCEVGRACAGMSREEANAILPRIVALYEDRLSDPPHGKTFPECYDPIALKPTAEYREIYYRVMDQLSELGVSFGADQTAREEDQPAPQAPAKS